MARLPTEIIDAILARGGLRGREIRDTIGKGMTRRDVLKGVGEVVGKRKSAASSEDMDLAKELEYYLARQDLEDNPKLWKPEWGPLEEADPEDIIHAATGMGRSYEVMDLTDLIREATERKMLG